MTGSESRCLGFGFVIAFGVVPFPGDSCMGIVTLLVEGVELMNEEMLLKASWESECVTHVT